MNPHTQPFRMNLIGCGRVGQTLAHLWQRADVVRVQGLYSRSKASAQGAQTFIGAGKVCETLAQLPQADLWLIAVPDAAIAQVASALCAARAESGDEHAVHPPIALHASGFLASSALAPLAALGWLTASSHPVRSFATPDLAAAQFAGTPIGLEGHANALPALQAAFEAIGGQCFHIQTAAKPLYHAAAVFSNNFTVVLQGIAQGLWQEAGVNAAMRHTLMHALLTSTVANLQDNSPAQALTGPAARGDTAVVHAQGQAVAQWDEKAGQVYALMSEIASRLKQQGHLGH
jgi:predicted short-subunit dehydrogenase-like oxidoreductase (DUF2520 family)